MSSMAKGLRYSIGQGSDMPWTYGAGKTSFLAE